MNEALVVRGEVPTEFQALLNPQALAFLAELEHHFGERRNALLLRRKQVQEKIDQGHFPKFLDETLAVRQGSWVVAPYPKDLSDRRVEITGPVDRKMVINALNSGAKVFMADFEDSHSPTWLGTLQGQVNLTDAVRGTITYENPNGKTYELGKNTATLMVRPRGWHLVEKHVTSLNKPMSASLFDFGLYFFHNASVLIKQGSGPYFYLPKMESHLEARLWNDVFLFSQERLGIPRGTIKATVLIETILAAFEMDEILFELREHSAGLNCGRWDYIFSFIKKMRNHADFVLPDRNLVTMEQPFLKAYYELLIQTCHRRAIHAMGGMAAQIPIKDNEEKNRMALEKVRLDKQREVKAGHDGTWVAHPGLVTTACDIFDQFMKKENQIELKREDVHVTEKDLLSIPKGEITELGLRTNINIGILYLESWLRGNGCVPLYHLMEDAATAEISRAQVWQWIRFEKGRFSNGTKITKEFVQKLIREEMSGIEKTVGPEKWGSGKYTQASTLFEELVFATEFQDFLTLKAYNFL